MLQDSIYQENMADKAYQYRRMCDEREVTPKKPDE